MLQTSKTPWRQISRVHVFLFANAGMYKQILIFEGGFGGEGGRGKPTTTLVKINLPIFWMEHCIYLLMSGIQGPMRVCVFLVNRILLKCGGMWLICHGISAPGWSFDFCGAAYIPVFAKKNMHSGNSTPRRLLRSGALHATSFFARSPNFKSKMTQNHYKTAFLQTFENLEPFKFPKFSKF